MCFIAQKFTVHSCFLWLSVFEVCWRKQMSWWHIPVILATQEVGKEDCEFEDSLGNVSRTISPKQNIKRTEGLAQAVEHLCSTQENRIHSVLQNCQRIPKKYYSCFTSNHIVEKKILDFLSKMDNADMQTSTRFYCFNQSWLKEFKKQYIWEKVTGCVTGIFSFLHQSSGTLKATYRNTWPLSLK
jgi:hypothetical protein